MKLKIEGNGLGLQCRGAEIYNVPTHHQHEQESTGAQCVNCHMPTNRYMGVDDRRDHSFKIPRPDLSLEFDTPNACVQCHEDKDNLWAAKTLNKWHGKPKASSSTRHNYYLLNSGQPISLEKHKAIINDKDIDVITRATALRLLNITTQTVSGQYLELYLKSYHQLIKSIVGVVRAEQAVLEMSLGNWTSAEESFKSAIEVDPYFESGYLNLSELYRNLQRPE